MIKTVNLHNILLSVVLFSCATAQAQFQPLSKMAKENNAMTFKLEKNSGYIQRVVINESDMEYVMQYKGGNRFFSIRPGKNIIEQFPANSQEAKGKFQQHENMRFYPGKEVKESKVGKVVTLKTIKLPYKTFSPLFHTSNGDIRIEDKHELQAVIEDKLQHQEK